MKLVKFEDVYSKNVYINPDRVNLVKEYESGMTVISVGEGEGESITVKMETARVAELLLNASKF